MQSRKRASRDNTSLTVPELVDKIRSRSDGAVVGLQSEQVRAVSDLAPGSLPADYLEWLSLAGISAGDFMSGSDLGYDWMQALQRDARDCTAKSGGPQLPQDAFVFLGHQGYVYLWFYTSSQDRAVYRYVEGNTSFDRVGESFTHWLRDAVRDEFG